MESFSSTFQKNDFHLHFDLMTKLISMTRNIRKNPLLSEKVSRVYANEDMIYHVTRQMHGSFSSYDKMTRFGEIMFHLSRLISRHFVTHPYFTTNGQRRMSVRVGCQDANIENDSQNVFSGNITYFSFSYIEKSECVRVRFSSLDGRNYIWNVYRNGSTRIFAFGISGWSVSHIEQITWFEIVGGGQNDWTVEVHHTLKRRVKSAGLTVIRERLGYDASLSWGNETRIVMKDNLYSLEHKFGVDGNKLLQTVSSIIRRSSSSRLNALADAFDVSQVGPIWHTVQAAKYLRNEGEKGRCCFGGNLLIAEERIHLI